MLILHKCSNVEACTVLSIHRSTQFKKDLKKAVKQGKPIAKLAHIIDLLCHMQPLLRQYRDHALLGNWQQYRECHIEPDWLLIYRINNTSSCLELHRLGSHSELLQ